MWVYVLFTKYCKNFVMKTFIIRKKACTDCSCTLSFLDSVKPTNFQSVNTYINAHPTPEHTHTSSSASAELTKLMAQQSPDFSVRDPPR